MLMLSNRLPDDRTPFPLSPNTWHQVAKQMNLPPQHKRVVACILRDMTDQQIADHLELAVPTIRTYLKRIYERAGTPNRLRLVLHIMKISQKITAEYGAR
jgi:DNA-binding CsgD family transcriptional regulator